MFDVGFLELAVILVLGLLVLGPERLPQVAQKIGYWVGKGRRYIDTMKAQVESEFDTEEMKKLIKKQNSKLRDLQSKLIDTQDDVKAKLDQQLEEDDSVLVVEPINSVEELIPYKETLKK